MFLKNLRFSRCVARDRGVSVQFVGYIGLLNYLTLYLVPILEKRFQLFSLKSK